MSFETKPMGARLGISGVLEFKDKDGNILERVQMQGSIPLDALDLSDEHKNALLESAHAPDDRQ
jgi:hypothetical protein